MLPMTQSKKDIVIIGYRDWCYAEEQGVNVRDLHFAVELAKSGNVHKVLFVNRPVTLVEQVFRGKRWKLRTGEIIEAGFGYRLCKIFGDSELYVLCTWVPDFLSPLLLGRVWWNSAFRKPRIKSLIARAKRTLGMRDDVMILCTPFGISATESVGFRHLIFDVIDNFAMHLRMRASERRFCESAYRSIGKKADTITCVSALSMKLFPESKNMVLVRNGVDRKWLDLNPPKPREFESMKGRVVGFGGNITRKFAVGFLAKVASLLPEVNFVLIGNVLDRGVLSGFNGIGNIHHLGFRNFSRLPAYYYHMDAGMILYQAEKAHDEDPLKLYEYLSLGTPAISLPAKWVQPRFDGVLFTAETPELFAAALEGILRGNRQDWRSKCRQAIFEDDFWDSKAEAIIESIDVKQAG